jgi:glycine/D-amino acid oxidase-like deaminating enzyme
MARLYTGTPLWLGASEGDAERLRFPALRGARTVDIAIVGGGFTGAAIAWRLAQAGIRVAVLEASRIGRGSTGASTALLMQEPDNDLTDLAKRYGRGTARRVWELSRDATRECVESIEQLGVSCELARCDSVYYALTTEAGRRLRREYRSRQSAGFDGQSLDRPALLRETHIAGYGAIRVTDNGQLNPLLACLGFARAAADRGALIFEESPVRVIRPARDHVTVTTRSGTVRADYVVVATGYATARVRPLTGRFRLLTTYVAATRPLTERERRELGLGPVQLWDTDRPYHYARFTNDHRLLIGGGDQPNAHGRSRRQALRAGIEKLRAYFTHLLPALEDVALEYGWDGLFAMTRDGLPYIGTHRRYARHLFALGYGGNGMTFGFLAGRLLRDWYVGRDARDLDLFAFSRASRARRAKRLEPLIRDQRPDRLSSVQNVLLAADRVDPDRSNRITTPR